MKLMRKRALLSTLATAMCLQVYVSCDPGYGGGVAIDPGYYADPEPPVYVEEAPPPCCDGWGFGFYYDNWGW